jgi:hypothetical protein
MKFNENLYNFVKLVRKHGTRHNDMRFFFLQNEGSQLTPALDVLDTGGSVSNKADVCCAPMRTFISKYSLPV